MDMNEMELIDLHQQVREFKTENKQLKTIVEDLVDRDECHYDQRDYCQAHGLYERPCPHEKAKELLG
jgi:hypothetical protein